MADYRIVTNGKGVFLVEQRRRFLWWTWWSPPLASVFFSRKQAEDNIVWRQSQDGPWWPVGPNSNDIGYPPIPNAWPPPPPPPPPRERDPGR